ncbi:MAG TPA: hypothetical protein EYP56_01620 [Planctomycetaceae bacterium]|nr:hypothetical protein [Planctomycetaceae bacterium]HIQ22305.1 hypothetical protein [Planctomycetota bacterium]
MATILVVCPNGHSLKVKSSLAGKTGRCPVCRALVKVPNPSTEKLSEEAILQIISSPDEDEASERGSGPREIRLPHGAGQPMKSCSRCNREIPATTHICPYCHTYIAGLSDFQS